MSSLAASDHPEAPLFSDGLGDRVVSADGAMGELLQILRLRPELTAVPSFEFALRERAARLANFRHTCYVRVRRVDRGMAPASVLSIVSDHLEGTRLSDILSVAYSKGLQLDINAALCLIRQLVPAVAVLHENARDVAHGLIAPERLVVTSNGRLVIVEHVLGAAVEQLQFTRERLWHEFRVAMPPSAGLPRFDHRADVAGMGLVALALLLGRPLGAHEYPHHIPRLLNDARERTAIGEEQPLSPLLRTWLERALQVDVRRSFASAPEALAALEEFIADDSMYIAAPVALDSFLSLYSASLLEPDVIQPAVTAEEPLARLRSQAWPDPPARPEPPARPSAATMQLIDLASFDMEEPAVEVRAEPRPISEVLDITDLLGPSESFAEVHDLSELLGPEPLTVVPPPPPRHVEASSPIVATPLFNPDAPFTARALMAPDAGAPRRSMGRLAVVAAVALALAGGGLFAVKFYMRPAPAPAMGTLVVRSNPAGVRVVVDGVDRGRTPAHVSLPAGAHILELRGRGVPRVIPINVTGGSELSQYLEFADVPATGFLSVQSDPSGAKVIVDGTERGVAPLTIPDLAPGLHRVELQANGLSAHQTVNLQAGGTASLVVPLGAEAAGPVSGWISVKAPFTMEIREGGRLLGSTDSDRLMIAAGRHELELSSAPLGYRVSRVVQVAPGKVAVVTLDLPRGVVSLNATPWAEVWIDGERVGDTPIGNLAVAIGSHEIVFKHPQLGEKRQAVSVTLAAPIRVSVDMK